MLIVFESFDSNVYLIILEKNKKYAKKETFALKKLW